MKMVLRKPNAKQSDGDTFGVWLAWLIALFCIPHVAMAASPSGGGQRSATTSHSVGARRSVTLSPTQQSTVSLPKAGAGSSQLNSDLRQAEHVGSRNSASQARSVRTRRSSAPQARASAMNFTSRPARPRGNSNFLGKGSGSKRYGGGRRITEKQR